MVDSKISEMLETNVEQKKYYEVASGAQDSAVNSTSTNLWRRLRKRAFSILKDVNHLESLKGLHREWIGDASQLTVLDLGVGNGNVMSLEIAAAAKEYVAIDLSESRIEEFRNKLDAAGVDSTKARALSVDFLSDDFEEGSFDLIYAMAVVHHFRHIDALFDTFKKKLAPGGRIITYDPVQVWLPIRILRSLYRPFQTDAAWEYPFGMQALSTIEKRFEVINCQGFLGSSKWAAVVGMLSPRLGGKLANRWHESDMKNKNTTRSIKSCLHVSYHLRPR